jgi:hypothetical protein
MLCLGGVAVGQTPNASSFTPAASSGGQNCIFQHDSSGNFSCYIPTGIYDAAGAAAAAITTAESFATTAVSTEHTVMLAAVAGAGSGSARQTIIVAASDSPYPSAAQYIATGTADQTTINAAIAACPATLPTSTGPAQCTVILETGVYHLSGSVVVDADDVTLTGEGHCMWGGYKTYTPPVGPSNPMAPAGTGCSQLLASAASFPLIAIEHNNLAGTGTDTQRHRGIEIKQLYLVGYNYGNVGIQTLCGTNPSCYTLSVGNYTVTGEFDDHSLITDNVFEKLSVSMNVMLDAPDIERNSCQDNSDTCLVIDASTGVVAHNLFYDVGGDGMDVGGFNIAISSNNVGDLNTLSAGHSIGFNIWGNHMSLIGNTSHTTSGGMIALHSSVGSSLVGNTFDNRTSSTVTMQGPVFSIDSGSSGTVATGNTFDTTGYPQSVYVIDNESSGSQIFGNTFIGTWSPANESHPGFSLTNVTVSGNYFGPASAPAGNCTSSGAWVFSQDGAASFCNGSWVAQIAAAAAATVYVNTTFSEASSGTALAGTAPAVLANGATGPWTAAAGQPSTGAMKYGTNAITLSNICGSTGGLAGYCPVTINYGAANFTARFTLTAIESSGPDNLAVIFRWTNANNFSMLLLGGGNAEIYDVVSGTATNVAHISYTATVGAYKIVVATNAGLAGTGVTVTTPSGATVSGVVSSSNVAATSFGFSDQSSVYGSPTTVSSLEISSF